VSDVFAIKPGFCLYTYPRAKTDDGYYKATFEPSLSLEYTLNDLVFSLSYYYDFTMKGGGYEFGINYSIPIKPLEIDVELSALIGRYDQSDVTYRVDKEDPKEGNKGDYYQAGISIPYEFSSKSKLSVGWYYTKGINNYIYIGKDKAPYEDAIGRGVFQVSFSQSF